MTAVLSSKYWGSYLPDDRNRTPVNSISELIGEVRELFGIGVDAIAILRDDKIVGLWIAEPDVDCNEDGYYEVRPKYVGEEYNLYRPGRPGFWGAVAYHFGIEYVPVDSGFIARKTVAI